MSEQECQRKYDAKMSQMEREHREQLNRLVNTVEQIEKSDQTSSNALSSHTLLEPSMTPEQGPPDTDAATGTITYPSTGTYETEEQRGFDAKMAIMTQEHRKNMEKRGDSEESETAEKNVTIVPEKSGEQYEQLSSPEPSKDALLEDGYKADQSNQSTEQFPSSTQRLSPSLGDRVFTAQRGIAVAPDVEEGTFQETDNELAVAIPIDEDEQEDVEVEMVVSAYAVEYDPNSKPPLYKNRRFRLYGIGGCCIFFVLLIVSVSVSVKNRNSTGSSSGEITYIYLTNAPTVSPTEPPTNTRENIFRSYFAEEVSPLVYEPGTPLFMAAEWILYKDPQRLNIGNSRLLQR